MHAILAGVYPGDRARAVPPAAHSFLHLSTSGLSELCVWSFPHRRRLAPEAQVPVTLLGPCVLGSEGKAGSGEAPSAYVAPLRCLSNM